MKSSHFTASWLFVVFLCFGLNAYAGERILVTGSSTVLPIIQNASASFVTQHPDTVISLSSGGTSCGIKALIEGSCDIAMASRDFKEKELQLAQENGFVFHRVSIAADALLPVVNPKNPIHNLTLQELRAIFAGKIVNWKELGGEDAPIVVVTRDKLSGTYETWLECVMDNMPITPLTLMQVSNNAIVRTVSKNQNAIGYIGYSYLNHQLKAISVDNIFPNERTVTNGEWEMSRVLYLFTKKNPRQVVLDFIDFLLDPEEGQIAVDSAGCIRLYPY